MLKNIKCAIFDMDGTLVDSLIVWNVLWKEFGKRFLSGKDFAPNHDDDKAIRTMTLEGAMYLLHDKYGLAKDGKELLDTAIEIIENFYANDVTLKDGVLEFLEYCSSKNIKMCIASATELRLVKIAAEHCKIAKYFEGVYSCAEIGSGKDKPDIYILASESLGMKIGEVCVFEDSHVAINTSHGLGMKTVGIFDKFNYGQDEIKKIADYYIDDGETLMKLVRDGNI